MKVKDYFKIQEADSTVSREVIGGMTSFMTAAYILFVQPAVLSSLGMDFGAVMVATAISSFLACVFMGVIANYPIILAPAMGHNFFFAYTVCLGMGISWQVALGAIAVGIGLLIALVGLQWGGIVVAKQGTMIGLGALNKPYVILTIAGLIITSLLLAFRIRGALLLGIIISAIIGMFMGLVKYQGFVSLPPSISPTFLKLEPLSAFKTGIFMVIFVFFFLDVFDTVGTLIGVGQQAGLMKEGKLPKARKALFSDALGTVFGTLLGTSTITSYIESTAGVVAGARTGFSSLVAGLCFLFSIFFYPLVRMIGEGVKVGSQMFHPVTAPALILVGSFMLKNVKFIEWDDPTEAIPAFITLIIMPLTFSITEGIAFGFISYFLLKLFTKRWKELNPLVVIFAILFILRYIYIYR